MIDLSQSDIQKGYGLYIENDIRYAYSSPRQIGASILVQVTYPRMYIKSLAVNESKTKGFFIWILICLFEEVTWPAQITFAL